MESIYEILKSLPLLKGVSNERIQSIVSATPLHFLKYLDGETVVSSGEPMTHLVFLIRGAVKVTTVNASERFSVEQTLRAPDVIVPDFLFGRSTRCPSTVVASGDCGIIKISKADFTAILRSDDIILFNYLNLLSAAAQLRIDGIMSLTDGLLEERIAFWVVALTQTTATDICISCRHRELSSFFGVQRSSFIATLESMAARGLIVYDAASIRPVSRQAMRALLLNASASQ